MDWGDIKTFGYAGLLLFAVWLGFSFGKAPWVEAGTLNCTYTFPTLETHIDVNESN